MNTGRRAIAGMQPGRLAEFDGVCAKSEAAR
jgi:hypothetical protein